MTQVDGGVVECDGCGQTLLGTLRDSVIIQRANYDLGRVEVLHLCLEGVDDKEGCAALLEGKTKLKYYQSKLEERPVKAEPARVKKQRMPTKKAKSTKA